jgi:hypothetical protein
VVNLVGDKSLAEGCAVALAAGATIVMACLLVPACERGPARRVVTEIHYEEGRCGGGVVVTECAASGEDCRTGPMRVCVDLVDGGIVTAVCR